MQEGDATQAPGGDNDHQLQPLNIRMLQGAFYMLLIGYFLSGTHHYLKTFLKFIFTSTGLVLIFELNHIRLHKVYVTNKMIQARLKKRRQEKCEALKEKITQLEVMVGHPIRDLILSYDEGGAVLDDNDERPLTTQSSQYPYLN